MHYRQKLLLLSLLVSVPVFAKERSYGRFFRWADEIDETFTNTGLWAYAL